MKRTQHPVSHYLSMYGSDAKFSNMDGFPGSLNFEGESPGEMANLNATGPVMQGLPQISKPYFVSITNATAGTLTAVLFGYNDNMWLANFGSPAGITVTSSGGTVGSYQRLLAQSNNMPFNLLKFVLMSSNTSQLTQEWTVVYFDANNRQCQDPIPVIPDSYQQLTTQVELIQDMKIDANSQINIPVLANTTLNLYMYPVEIANQARPLIGGPATKQYVTPKIMGRGNQVVITAPASAAARNLVVGP